MTVLVVGAGPAGLTTAITLARYGVDTLLVERRPQPSTLPRATVATTRTMELFRSWGLHSEVCAAGVDVRWQAWMAPSLASPDGTAVDLGLPSPELAARLSPTGPACVPQDSVEAILLTYLATFPYAEVRRGTELVWVRESPDGIEARLRDTATGATSTCHPTHVVAADGAHSLVRQALGIEMDDMAGEAGVAGEAREAGARGIHGSTLQSAVATLFQAPLWDVVGERRYGIYSIMNPAASGVVLPAGGDRWVYGRDCDPDAPPPAAAVIAEQIRLAVGVPDLAPEILRVGTFSFDARLARQYRRGNVFLVGDAAHRITPRGGTGMNTAVHDGYDLGWKLAWVLLGWAAPGLLDSYEAERRPVGRRNATRSAQPDGSFRDPVDELAADLGGRVPHAWLPWRKVRASTLDLVGPGLTMFVGPDAVSGDGPARERALDGLATDRAPLDVYRLDVHTAEALDIPSSGTLLLRPDGKAAAATVPDLLSVR